jgi:hypothetical protein
MYSILTKRILYKTYTHAAYTHKTYTHTAYTVTKRILYRTYTEHTVYSRIFSQWCSIHYREPDCHAALAAAKFTLTIRLT